MKAYLRTGKGFFACFSITVGGRTSSEGCVIWNGWETWESLVFNLTIRIWATGTVRWWTMTVHCLTNAGFSLWGLKLGILVEFHFISIFTHVALNKMYTLCSRNGNCTFYVKHLDTATVAGINTTLMFRALSTYWANCLADWITTLLARTSLYTEDLTVPPIASTAPFPWWLSK